MSSVLTNPMPVLDSWDALDLLSILNSPSPPVNLNPGLEETNTYQTQNQNYSTGLYRTDKDERRKKLRKSNRESARRSRMKKQKHLEDVRSQLYQLRIENRELVNQFRYAMHYCQRANMENNRLRLEHHVLHEKLLSLRQALVLRQIQQSSTCATWSSVNSTVVTVQQNPSIIRDHVI